MIPFEVWYMKRECLRDGLFGLLTTTRDKLEKTHIKLREIEAQDLEEVFSQMQGEVWSPQGEARQLIESLGLLHTSMSVGDVIVDQTTNEAWMVEPIGWKKLGEPDAEQT